jgi:hypothetical protein
MEDGAIFLGKLVQGLQLLDQLVQTSCSLVRVHNLKARTYLSKWPFAFGSENATIFETSRIIVALSEYL